MLGSLASALAARDASTAAHSTRVTLLATRIGSWLGWDGRRLRELEVGASLHDVGKLAVAESILRKRGPLDPRELAEIRTHPVAGAKLVAPLWPLRFALPYVLYHHERWDGGGYPTGREARTVPEEVRLLSVADAFDAMTTTRPYRWAVSPDRALRELERCSGTQFDPAMAEAFVTGWHAGVLSRSAA